MSVWGMPVRRTACVGLLVLGGLAATAEPAAASIPTTIQNFTGQVGSAFGVTPPDPIGAAGPNHYVQAVNTQLEIWNKSGTVLAAAKNLNTLWTGYTGTNAGNGCSSRDDGDPIVRYDQLADRWLIAQFSLPNESTSGGPSFECVAVSKTADPTGAYYLYDFKHTFSINDQTKIAVWADAYYETANLYNAAGASAFNYASTQVCAWDRVSMLAGKPATQQCFNVGSTYFGMLAASLDGTVPPPPGSPEYVVAEDGNTANTLDVWKFHVDWTTPANSTLTGPSMLTTQSFTDTCASQPNSGGVCIPQPSSGQLLESQAGIIMDRATYRNFGTHESLLLTNSVTAGAGSGIGWYELRMPNGTPTIYQQGIYAPADANWRWMPSAAQDEAGDVLMGFSLSSNGTGTNAVTHPAIGWAGRVATDTVGQMGQGEAIIDTGAGNESGANRWGDYTGMTVDPTDDCTFWYTNEIYSGTGSGTWATKIATVKFPNCGANDFSLGAGSDLTVAQGAGNGESVTTTSTKGSAESVDLAVSGLPAGASASFSPATVTAGTGSTLTVTAGAQTPPGDYPLLVTGTAPSTYHGVTITLHVTANAVPSCVDQPGVTVAPDTATPLTLNCSDADAADTLAYAVTTPAAHGIVSAPDSAGHVTYTPDTGYSGPDSFGFKATDNHGAASNEATVSLTVQSPDTSAPTVTIKSGPAGWVHTTSASIAFSVSDPDDAADALTVTCALDGATAAPCTSPVSLTGLAQGSHTLLIQATDPASNTSSASRSWSVDTVLPTATTTAPTARLTLATSIVAASTATDNGSGVASRDWRYRRAAYNATFGAFVYPAAWQATQAATESLTGAPGYAYCISTRARDVAGNVSGWSAERCTAVALDDRALTASSGWTRTTGTVFYLHTATVTTHLGAVLTRTGLATDRLGLVATRCKTCGEVGVYVNGTRLAVVNLAATTTQYHSLILLPTFSLRAATVTIKVLTSGKPVQIDGLASSRV